MRRQGDQQQEQQSSARNTPQQIRERIVWRVTVVMLLAIVGWLTYVASQAQEQVEELEAELEGRAEGTPEAFGLSTEGVRRFQAAGIEAELERHLLERLADQGEWLAEQISRLRAPVSLDPEGSVVLSDRWIFATVEHAEGAGTALLGYGPDEAGELSWEVLGYASEQR
ncbi:MAG: hypothetical protein ACLFMS_00555 [Halorhodospira sp.]